MSIVPQPAAVSVRNSGLYWNFELKYHGSSSVVNAQPFCAARSMRAFSVSVFRTRFPSDHQSHEDAPALIHEVSSRTHGVAQFRMMPD